MAYAQKNYNQTQGISGRYSIASIGCFVTAFCNLEEDYGNGLPPDALDNFFRDNDVYIDIDDGIRDDLDWQLINRYDPATTVGHTADHGKDQTAGWPTTNQSIVRFYYRSYQSGQMIFHFCKVADASAHLILDSWDGQVKKSPYGEPTAWAEYNHSQPAPVSAPPPPTYQVTETYAGGKQVQLNKQPTNLWGMNYSDPGALPPVEVHDQSEIWTVTNKVHHQNGYDYYRREDQIDGFNVLDCDDYTPPPPPTPAPPSAPVPIPTSTDPYTVLKTILGFSSSNDAANHMNAKTTVEPGNYYIFNRRYSPTKADEIIAINVTMQTGKAGSWINPNDNVEDVPEPPKVPPVSTGWTDPRTSTALEEAAKANQPTPVPVTVKPPSPDAWKKMVPLNPEREPELYISLNKSKISVRDMEQKRSPLPLEPLSPVHIIGTFVKDNVEYGRTVHVANQGLWYGIPMGILDLAEYKDTKVTDYITLIKNKIRKLIHDVRF